MAASALAAALLLSLPASAATELDPADISGVVSSLSAAAPTKSEAGFCRFSGAPTGITIRDPRGRWDRSKVRVCWANGSGTHYNACMKGGEIRHKLRPATRDESHYRTLIQSIVTQEYRVARTGIEFVGWENCPADKDASEGADVVLYLGKSPEGIVTGEAIAGRCLDPEGATGFVRIFLPEKPQMKIALDDALRATALHEFGHAAGLKHEDSGGIFNLDTGKIELVKQSGRDRAQGNPVSAYDRSSIMSLSYVIGILNPKGLRFTEKRGDHKFQPDPLVAKVTPIAGTKLDDVSLRIGLSSGDVNALRCLYAYSEEEKKLRCNRKYKPWEHPELYP
jgi:hypothetical protein